MMRLIKILLVSLLVVGSAAKARENEPKKDPPPPVQGGDGTTVEGGGNNMDACGAALCLAGVIMTGSNPSQCSSYIEKYFLVIGKRHGVFDPSKTLSARKNFLKQCKSGDSDSQNTVNDKYGKSRGL
jgi:hypothetical protein